MSPAAIVERLGDRFRLLRGGRKGDRHATLYETLRWSYSLLERSEAVLFDRLSVFAGGFTMAAAETVCADDEVVESAEVLDLLGALVDKSMVIAEPTASGDRYRLLETLREFGSEALTGRAERDRYTRAHARYYCELAQAQEPLLWTAAEPDVRRMLDPEWDNLRAAFTFLLGAGDVDSAANLIAALGWYATWSCRDELQSGAELLLARPNIEPHPRFVDVCGVAAFGAFNRADLHKALDIGERALRTGRRDPAGLVYVAAMAASVNLGDESRTQRYYQAWLTDAEASPAGVRAHAENMMGLYRARMQGSAAGVAFTDRGMQLALDGGSPSSISYAHMCRGYTLGLADPDEAMASFRRSIEIAADLDEKHTMVAFSHRGLADLTLQHGTLDEALRVCRESLLITIDHHKTVVVVAILAPSALALDRAGESAIAATLLGCLTAHGQRPPATVDVDAFATSHPEPFSRGTGLTIQQAAEVAVSGIDAVLNRSSGVTRAEWPPASQPSSPQTAS